LATQAIGQKLPHCKEDERLSLSLPGPGSQREELFLGNISSYNEICEEAGTTESRREAEVPLGVIYSGVYPF